MTLLDFKYCYLRYYPIQQTSFKGKVNRSDPRPYHPSDRASFLDKRRIRFQWRLRGIEKWKMYWKKINEIPSKIQMKNPLLSHNCLRRTFQTNIFTAVKSQQTPSCVSTCPQFHLRLETASMVQASNVCVCVRVYTCTDAGAEHQGLTCLFLANSQWKWSTSLLSASRPSHLQRPNRWEVLLKCQT